LPEVGTSAVDTTFPKHGLPSVASMVATKSLAVLQGPGEHHEALLLADAPAALSTPEPAKTSKRTVTCKVSICSTTHPYAVIQHCAEELAASGRHSGVKPHSSSRLSPVK